MKTISQSLIFAGIVLALLAGVFAFSAINVEAQSSCGSCDPTPGGGGDPTPGGGGGGGSSNPPSCEVSVEGGVSVVEQGDQYTIKWNGSPTNGTFELNDYPVDAVGQKTYTFTAENQSRFVFTGLNGDGNCVDEVIVMRKTVPAPVCEMFTATPGNLPSNGGDVVLNWDTTNAQEVKLDGVTVSDDGTDTVNVTSDTTFVLDVANAAGSVSCTASVVLAQTPAPTCDLFEANPATITVGESTTLTWETTEAVQVFLNNGIGNDNGNLTVDGSFQVAPLTDTTYVLTVIGAEDKTVDCSAPVIVNPVVVNDTPNISIIKRDNADKDDTQEVSVGGTATFEIVVTNTGDEDLVNVTVTDPIEPACDKTIGALAVGASDTYTCTTTNVTAAFTNTASVTGDSAVDGETVTDTDPTDVTVATIVDPVCEDTAANNTGGALPCTYTADDTPNISIIKRDNADKDDTQEVSVGGTATFEIVVTNTGDEDLVNVTVTDPIEPACDKTIGALAVGASDTYTCTTTNVTAAFTNTASVTGDSAVDGEAVTDTDPTQVTIPSSGGGSSGGSSSPRCELDISAEQITAGSEVELTWESSRATELTISDNFGNIIVTTEDKLSSDKDDLFDGNITLNPTRNTTYTLLVERGSRDRECEVDVEVDDQITLLQVRDQAPLVSGISLTQVPYTGFEAGPVMTVLFYMLLVTWALYITYVLVMPKTRLAMVPVTSNVVKTNEDLMAHAEQIRPDAFAAVASAPVVEAPANLPTANAVSAMPVVTEIPDTNTVENQAHALQALVSSDAARTIAGMVQGDNQAEVVAKIVADAKRAFPLEDGWVVINQSRLAQLTDTSAVQVSPSPTGAGSLAEAIVTGNVVAAYELVGARPMIALADAATDLDALYRTRKGAAAEVSEMLTSETTNLADEQIAEMIAALTGALDGTYSDEASAVKMAIMKAVNIAG